MPPPPNEKPPSRPGSVVRRGSSLTQSTRAGAFARDGRAPSEENATSQPTSATEDIYMEFTPVPNSNESQLTPAASVDYNDAEAVEDVLISMVNINLEEGDDDDDYEELTFDEADESGTDTEDDDGSGFDLESKLATIKQDAPVFKRTLSASVRQGNLSAARAAGAARWMDSGLRKLIGAMKTYGTPTGQQYVIDFGLLRLRAGKLFWGQALAGTLQTAQEKGIVSYEGGRLLPGPHDRVKITLIKQQLDDSSPDAYTYGQIRNCSVRRPSTAIAQRDRLVSAAVHAVRDPSSTTAAAPSKSSSFADDLLASLDQAQEELNSLVSPSKDKGPSVDQLDDPEAEFEEQEAIEDVLSSLVAGLSDKSSAASPASHASVSVADKARALPSTTAGLHRRLSVSVRKGALNPHRALLATQHVDREVRRLVACVQEYGTKGLNGKWQVSFGKLQMNTVRQFSGAQLVGLLKTARSRGVVEYKADVLVKGASDNVMITLLKTAIEDGNIDTYTFQQVRQASVRMTPSRNNPVEQGSQGRRNTLSSSSFRRGRSVRGSVRHSAVPEFDSTLAKRLMQLEAEKAKLDNAKGDAQARIKELEDDLVVAQTEAEQLQSELDAQVDEHEDIVACYEDDLEAERTARQELQALLDSERVLNQHTVEDLQRELQGLKDSASKTTSEVDAAMQALRDKLDTEAKARQALETEKQEVETQHKQELEALRLAVEQDLRAQLEADLTESLTASLRATLTKELRPVIEAEVRKELAVAAPAAPATPAAPAVTPSGPVTGGANRFEAVRLKAQSLKASSQSFRRKVTSLPTVTEDEATEAVADVMANMEAVKENSGQDSPSIKTQTLRQSVRSGNLPKRRAAAASQFVDTELRKLIEAIKELGAQQGGKYSIKFGDLNKRAGSRFQVLTGTLRTAKKQKVIDYPAEMILAGVHDSLDITLLQDELAHSSLDKYTYEEVQACASQEKVASTVERARANSIKRQTQAFARPSRASNKAASGASKSTPNAVSMRPKVVVEGEEDAIADVFASLNSLHRRDERRKSRLGGIPEDTTATPGDADNSTLEVPETAAAMNRKLNASVKRGELSEKRALQAARWVDKEIRKVIAAIQKHGQANSSNQHEVTFGKLFAETQNEFEALTGTLRTAKKKKVVEFDSEMLFQGQHDHIVIRLLKTEIPDSTISSYTYRQVTSVASKAKLGKSFGSESLQTAQQKCAVCGKTVYPMEFVGASGKAFHKNCFRCCVCKTKLLPSAYSTVNDRIFCKSHYEAAFKAGGGTYAF